MIGHAVALGAGFVRWWFAALADCVPQSVRRFVSGDGQRLHIQIDGERLVMTGLGRSDRRQAEVAVADWRDTPSSGAALSAFLAKNRIDRRAATIFLPAALVLRPRIEIPPEAAANLSQHLDTEVERKTPFSRDQVYRTFEALEPESDGEHIRAELAVARRNDVDTARTMAEAAGLTAIRVCPEGSADTEHANFLPAATPVTGRAWRYAGIGAAVTAMALVAVSVYLPFSRLETELAMADREIARLKQERAGLAASTSADIVGSLQGIVESRNRTSASAIGLLAEITRAVPDHSWVVQLQFDRNRVVITGFSRDANGLLKSLDRSPYLADVTFSAPVTRDRNADADRFQITASRVRDASS